MSVVIGGVVFQNGMQKQYPSLVEQLGPDTANLLSGSNAAASVGLVAQLPGPSQEIARGAYWNSLRTMYTVYVCFSGFGLLLSFFVGSRQLSKEHHEAKTGLKAMEEAREERTSDRRPSDEEKAATQA
jgi:hypothetical protein